MRLIDGDAAVERFKEAFGLLSGGEALPAAAIEKMIEIFFTSEKHTPTVETERRGVWSVIRDGGLKYRCSRCGFIEGPYMTYYCSHCGARMECQEAEVDE